MCLCLPVPSTAVHSNSLTMLRAIRPALDRRISSLFARFGPNPRRLHSERRLVQSSNGFNANCTLGDELRRISKFHRRGPVTG